MVSKLTDNERQLLWERVHEMSLRNLFESLAARSYHINEALNIKHYREALYTILCNETEE